MRESEDKAAGPAHATVFIWLFAISSNWHYLSSGLELRNYLFHFDPVITPLIVTAILTAFVGALFANRTWAVLLFAAGQLAVLSVRFPYVADHLVMELILNFAILTSFAWIAIRRRSLAVSATEMFELYAPIGRWLLIVMYFFGTFHKLNPGFLSPASSCALPFIDGFALPRALLDSAIVQYLAIYGTLILEALAMVLLLSARTKYYGMLLGMSFHFIIGISGFGTLAHFSAFALALHTLFLPSGIGQRLVATPRLPEALKCGHRFKAFTIVFCGLQVAFAVHLLTTKSPYLVNTLFAIYGVVLMSLVLKYGKMRSDDAPYRLRSPLPALNALPVVFFLYCTSPYVGLGTGGVLAMFSGLRTEAGISNHYVIREPIPLFDYQDTVIYVEDTNNPSLAVAEAERQGVVLFEFQRHFTHRENLALPLTVLVNGERFVLDGPDSVRSFVERFFTEQSWLARKTMSFRLVDEPQPDRCRH